MKNCQQSALTASIEQNEIDNFIDSHADATLKTDHMLALGSHPGGPIKQVFGAQSRFFRTGILSITVLPRTPLSIDTENNP